MSSELPSVQIKFSDSTRFPLDQLEFHTHNYIDHDLLFSEQVDRAEIPKSYSFQ